jgi:hypothetical protein
MKSYDTSLYDRRRLGKSRRLFARQGAEICCQDREGGWETPVLCGSRLSSTVTEEDRKGVRSCTDEACVGDIG